MTSLGVKCAEGFNGGLLQSFMLEVRDTHTQVRLRRPWPPYFVAPRSTRAFRLLSARTQNVNHLLLPSLHPRVPCQQEIKANYTSPLPRFAVSTLHPGNLYTVSIFAFNTKGRSEATVLQAAMLRLPEKQLTFEKGACVRVVRLAHLCFGRLDEHTHTHTEPFPDIPRRQSVCVRVRFNCFR